MATAFRIHARIVDKKTKLLTRTGLDWTEKYPAIATSLAKLPGQSAYIDGEVCAIRPDSTTSFSDLQAATDHKDATRLVYFAFDLLFIDGENLTTLPLVERKDRLKKLLRRTPKNIYFVDHVIGDGQAFYDTTCKHAAEGIVSKRVDAPYRRRWPRFDISPGRATDCCGRSSISAYAPISRRGKSSGSARYDLERVTN